MSIIKGINFDWENKIELHKKFKNEFDYLCSAMATLKKLFILQLS